MENLIAAGFRVQTIMHEKNCPSGYPEKSFVCHYTDYLPEFMYPGSGQIRQFIHRARPPYE